MTMDSTQILSSATVFSIDINKKCFLSSTKLSILVWFLKDCVIMSEFMNAELHYIFKYIKIEIYF